MTKTKYWLLLFVVNTLMQSLAVTAWAGVSCDGLKAIELPHVKITDVRFIGGVGFDVYGLPPMLPYCRVMGIASPTADSEIGFEIALPEFGTWNGNYLQAGNVGLGGTLPERYIQMGLSKGFATAGTDDGHQGFDGQFALGHPDKVTDFSYRALKETTDVAKAIIHAHYDKPPKYSYFAGASDGGREALVEAERYPQDFDGIISGAPAIDLDRLMLGMVGSLQALAESPASYIPHTKLKVIEEAALKACGDENGIIEEPQSCHFDPSMLRCHGQENDGCLTTPQITALQKIYEGAHDLRTGKRIAFGLEPGVEDEPQSWADVLTGYAPDSVGLKQSMTYAMAGDFLRYFVFGDPNYDLFKFNFDSNYKTVEDKLGHLLDADNPDLRAFKAHGGKLLQYHGASDPFIPVETTITYYQHVQSTMGDPRDFYRLFIMPGVMHGGGGRGPNVVPFLDAIIAWVEDGKVPDQLIATKYVDNNPSKRVERTRPICPYPEIAKWDEKGEKSNASSFQCTKSAEASNSLR
jgi:feruloyl esterase